MSGPSAPQNQAQITAVHHRVQQRRENALSIPENHIMHSKNSVDATASSGVEVI